jgi:hypothetical protein
MTNHTVDFSSWPIAHFCFKDVPADRDIVGFERAIYNALDREEFFVQIVEFKKLVVNGYLTERLSKPVLNEKERFIPQCKGVVVVTKEIGPMSHVLSQYSEFLQLPVPYGIVKTIEEARVWADQHLKL